MNKNDFLIKKIKKKLRKKGFVKFIFVENMVAEMEWWQIRYGHSK